MTDRDMIIQMLENLRKEMEKEDNVCWSAVMVYNKDKEDFPHLLNYINSCIGENYNVHDLFRISVINYKKYSFMIGISFYSAGRAVVLIKPPKQKEPLHAVFRTLISDYEFDLCYDICELSENYTRTKTEKINDPGNDIYSKWRTKKMPINKGMHNKQNNENTDDNNTLDEPTTNKKLIYSDDDNMNIMDEYFDFVHENFKIDLNHIESEKMKTIMANVNTFDVGTVHTIEQLTNLVRFMYYEYNFNNNLHVYDEKNNGSSFMPDCALKFMLRQFDVILDRIVTQNENDQMQMECFLDNIKYEVENLKIGYGIQNNFELYSDGTILGLFDTDNDFMIYAKDLKTSVIPNYFSAKERAFIKEDNKTKPFFIKICNETDFLNSFITVLFTDKSINTDVDGFLSKFQDDENNNLK